MKKNYEELELKVIRFATEDVITASGDEPCTKVAIPCTKVIFPCIDKLCIEKICKYKECIDL